MGSSKWRIHFSSGPERSKSLKSIYLIAFACVLMSLLFLRWNWSSPPATVVKVPQPLLKTNSATGQVFSGRKTRSFDRTQFFTNTTAQHSPPITLDILHHVSRKVKCKKWSVITTIFEPSEGVRRAAMLPSSEWCMVVIGDTKTPLSSYKEFLKKFPHVHFLSVGEQEAWAASQGKAINNFVKAMPTHHFARKNIGYLYAIRNNAEWIFDLDDDNLVSLHPTTKEVVPPPTEFPRGIRVAATGTNVLNHHILMNASLPASWARGFPLESILDNATHGYVTYEEGKNAQGNAKIGVLQFMAQGNPDVDAIHRLTKTLPMDFDESVSPLRIPLHTAVPYNAQATMHSYEALWATYLPMTVPGRVSDIWRSYFAQALFRAGLGLHVVFMPPPTITQDRNPHNYLADFAAEQDLYSKTSALVGFLATWQHPSLSLPERIEALWIDLYEREYIEVADVENMQLWLNALGESNYKLPIPKVP